MERGESARRVLGSLAAAAMLGLAPLAAADTLTFTSIPGATGPDGRMLGATATFTFDGACSVDCTLTIELANTRPMNGVTQALTDFEFSVDATLALTGADALAFADCTQVDANSDPICVFSLAPADSNAYDWTLTGGPSFVLAADPLTNLGIVRLPIDAGSDNVANPLVNPWLVGPVDFSLTYTGTLNVSDVSFSFGPGGRLHTVVAAVPEPGPLALVAIGALAMGLSLRGARRVAADRSS
jgi:hypothetical protein